MKNMSELEYLKLQYKKINDLFLSGKFDQVIEKSKKIIKKNAQHIPFYNFLALSYRQQGKLFLAEKILLEALKINPNDETVLTNLGSTYRGLIDYDKSEKYFKKALEIKPNSRSALINYANLKRDLNHFDDAIKIYEKAYIEDNKNQTLVINLAGIYQIVGDFKTSQEILEKFLEDNPNNALAHKLLSGVLKYRENNQHQKNMLLSLQNNKLKKYDEATLCFALAKSFEDQKNYKKSFEFFKRANDVQKQIMKNYSVKDEKNLFNKIKEIFNDTNFSNYSKNMHNQKKLIFILGLPRSGTTLAHQIIAAHSKVHGAGEVVILDQFLKKSIVNENFYNIFKKHLNENDIKIQNIIKNYFSKISYIKTAKNIILDKNPLNFQWIGFIKILFPNAKIIHCKRNLKDTALSIYKNAFHINSIVWSNNQDDLAEYISLYLDLMKFWNKKIPNYIYELSYEKLIENKQDEIKNLIKFCGLNWEEDCLNFSKKATPIKTVSITQARQEIYKTSLKSYKKYKDYLSIFEKIEEIENKY